MIDGVELENVRVMVVHRKRFTVNREEFLTRSWAVVALTEGENSRQRFGVRDNREPWCQTAGLTAFIRVAEMVVRGNPEGFVVTTVGKYYGVPQVQSTEYFARHIISASVVLGTGTRKPYFRIRGRRESQL